jgi:hypothetical protein
MALPAERPEGDERPPERECGRFGLDKISGGSALYTGRQAEQDSAKTTAMALKIVILAGGDHLL